MTSTAPTSEPQFSVRKLSTLLLIEGIVLVLLGLAAIALPALATLTLTIFLGWLFLISGIVSLVTCFWMRTVPGFWWAVLSAVLGILVGLLLIGQPATGAVSLTFVLVAFFIVEGIVTIMFAVSHRGQLGARTGFMVASGVITLILAALILAGLPGTAEWALGLLVGVDLVFGGVAVAMMGLAARRAA